MITQTEGMIIIGMAFYTLFIVGGIHYYEDKVKSLKEKNVELKKHTDHAMMMMLELSKDMSKKIKSIDAENKALQNQISMLKTENLSLRNGISTGYPEATL